MKGYVKVSTKDIARAVDNWDNSYKYSKAALTVFVKEMKNTPARKWWGGKSNKWAEEYNSGIFHHKVYEDCPRAYMYLEDIDEEECIKCRSLTHSEDNYALLDSELAAFVNHWKDVEDEFGHWWCL